MRNLIRSTRSVLAAVLTILGFCAALLSAAPAPATAATSLDRLVLTWVDGGEQLQVEGFAYRPRSVVDVRLGSQPLEQARADANGKVSLTVPDDLVATGQSGASIIVSGRSASGAARVLISAVPPRAAVRGPVDVLPWSIAGLAALAVAAGAVHRRRSPRTPAPAAMVPAGYLCRHAA
ncbi:hypothetical protein [Jidongwangia harbinensis]|uniref:hypothetical protein n=1 Tax=Jidongwangia harbinensis TaxID=2878561 RepID=UPI001CD99E61|nr:hypothetical protein [Jidongwangia harbinensis]MCA2213951.1 hypothetical protein [Jidongwangia harbinensis]